MTHDEFSEKKGGAFTNELSLVHRLILDAHPAIYRTVKYGYPFYCMKKNLFYLDVQKDRPLLALVYAYKMTDVIELLDFTGRTQIGHYFIDNLSDKKLAEVGLLIDTAVQFDLGRKR